MPDDDDANGEERQSTTTRAPRPIGGVVHDPYSARQSSSFVRLVASKIGELLTITLVTLGVMRPRNPDGTLGKRSWKRLTTTIGVAIAIVFVWTSIHIVKPGTVGVPVTLGHAGAPLSAGFHITLPLTSVATMNVRTQNYTMSSLNEGTKATTSGPVAVLGADGGAASVNASVLYRLDSSQAKHVYNSLGTNYASAIVRPTARECVRTTFTAYPVVQGSTTAWGKLETAVTLCMKTRLQPKGLTLQEFQLREVVLDPKLQSAVTSKISSQQNDEQQKFELQTATRAADITRIQALATADSQQILACGGVAQDVKKLDGTTRKTVVPNPINACTQAQLTPQYLQFTYLQALKQLVNSPNASTIILPFDKNLTPLLNVPTTSNNPTGNATTAPGTNGNAAVSGS